MADYFQEFNIEPLADGEAPNHFLHAARLFRDYGMFELLIDGQNPPPPAAKSVIENLPNRDIKHDKEQCTVCLRYFTIGAEAKELPCKHFYHSECIIPWLQKTNSCPLCRHELPTDDEVYEEYKRQRARASQREQDLETLHGSMFG
uniref:RING-type E3 ubiquitin transferase n=1 Tax=Xenopsylla cheopis TaxID=163159 RepID=A0A6M2DIA3_XENCH